MPIKSYVGGQTTILYTQQEAADAIGVSIRTLRSYLKQGRLPYVRIKRRVLIWDKHLMQYIRGARTTRIYSDVDKPGYECESFDGPPDPLYDDDGNDVFREDLRP